MLMVWTCAWAHKPHSRPAYSVYANFTLPLEDGSRNYRRPAGRSCESRFSGAGCFFGCRRDEFNRVAGMIQQFAQHAGMLAAALGPLPKAVGQIRMVSPRRFIGQTGRE